MAAAVTSARDPEGVLLTIVESLTNCMGVKGCSLMLLTWDGRFLLHTVACGLSESFIRKGPMPVDESVREALEGKAGFILDATHDERIQQPQEARAEGIKSMLTVPIILRNETIGVLRIYTGEPHLFSEDDTYFARVLAHLGAIALENARHYEKE